MKEEVFKKVENKYETILQLPDWYLQLQRFLDEYFYHYDTNKIEKSERWKLTRIAFVALVAKMLQKGSLAIGTTGVDMDTERLPIDTIVIHHTSTLPDTTLGYIEALTLIRLYTKEYTNKEHDYYGKLLWSGHFYNEKQTFHAYHYLIAQDGSIFHTLEDKYIGWQAGNWNVNCRSIAIAFIDELKENVPTENAINSAKEVIEQYKGIKIIGHKEIYGNTSCPGSQFDIGVSWKNKLLS